MRDAAIKIVSLFAVLMPLAGCGGADFSSVSQGLNGDLAPGYNTPLPTAQRNSGGPLGLPGGCYPMIETSFELSSIPGDPFDYKSVNVQAVLRKPDGSSITLPCFFDGDTIWKARYTPVESGNYSVERILLNGQIAHDTHLKPAQWTVTGKQEPGFVRIDPADHERFRMDNGSRYYPLGNNAAWTGGNTPSIPDLFARMHAAGENWSRVWMTSWAGLALDWPPDNKPGHLGDISLKSAEKWDQIVQAAQKNDIYFQMTLQHHGQYSSTVNPNWQDNPYNVKNGGFLQSPAQFFTNPEAIALTKRKLYYIVSRWGYSPNIMAFELFNEVQWTNAFQQKQIDDIASWHQEMAVFLKKHDINRHLITTSSAPDVPYNSPIWQPVDYIQAHLYPSDLITALSDGPPAAALKLKKPVFVGEFGPGDLKDPDGIYLHEGLWTGLMRWSSGAPEYWAWDNIVKNNLFSQYSSASAFLSASTLTQHDGLENMTLPAVTTQRASLEFAPGGSFTSAKESSFTVYPEGAPEGISSYPDYLQGQSHHAMTPDPLTFKVNNTEPFTFQVSVGKVAKSGALLLVGLDGNTVLKQSFAAKEGDYQPSETESSLSIKVPKGEHTITVQNTGADWVQIARFLFTNYSPSIQCFARGNKEFLAAWLYNRNGEQSPAVGTISLPGLEKGQYRLVWWDTWKGAAMSSADITVSKSGQSVTVQTPNITRDVAFYLLRDTNKMSKVSDVSGSSDLKRTN